jgi:hypothetical protein
LERFTTADTEDAEIWLVEDVGTFTTADTEDIEGVLTTDLGDSCARNDPPFFV